MRYGLYPIAAAAFEREVQARDGSTFMARNVVFQRTYKDRDGQYQRERVSLDERDIGLAIALLQDMQIQLIRRKMKQNEERRAQRNDAMPPPAASADLDDEISF
jgi:hypothetical protein